MRSFFALCSTFYLKQDTAIIFGDISNLHAQKVRLPTKYKSHSKRSLADGAHRRHRIKWIMERQPAKEVVTDPSTASAASQSPVPLSLERLRTHQTALDSVQLLFYGFEWARGHARVVNHLPSLSRACFSNSCCRVHFTPKCTLGLVFTKARRRNHYAITKARKPQGARKQESSNRQGLS